MEIYPETERDYRILLTFINNILTRTESKRFDGKQHYQDVLTYLKYKEQECLREINNDLSRI